MPRNRAERPGYESKHDLYAAAYQQIDPEQHAQDAQRLAGPDEYDDTDDDRDDSRAWQPHSAAACQAFEWGFGGDSFGTLFGHVAKHGVNSGRRK
jgi:hypothetical protein